MFLTHYVCSNEDSNFVMLIIMLVMLSAIVFLNRIVFSITDSDYKHLYCYANIIDYEQRQEFPLPYKLEANIQGP